MLKRIRNGLPPWARLAIGLLCTLVGLALIARPFVSLALLVPLLAIACVAIGATRLSAARRSPTRLDDGLALGFVLLGVAIAAWPNLSLRGVAWVAGGGLVAAGLVDLLASLRSRAAERLAASLQGAAHLVLGGIALAWPDVTVLVVALAFGGGTLLVGITELLEALRGPASGEQPRKPGWRGAGFGLLAVLVLALLSARLHSAETRVDAFYDPPVEIPAKPGVLLRAEAFTRNVPAGAVAWRILYTTARAEGEPALASALVIAPASTSGAFHPVIAWAHGTTGVAQRCAPSLLAEPLEAGAFFALERVLEQGWVLVASDYTGLGTAGMHPYLVGEAEGRSVLDAVRAARQLDELNLADATVVWGHSQGGGAALWTGQLAATYAPDVNVLGVAALAPVSNPVRFVQTLYDTPGGSIFAAYVLAGYTSEYADVHLEDYVRPAARPIIGELAERCLGEPAFLVSVLTSLVSGNDAFGADLLSGPLGERLQENIPTGPFPMPLLLAQGTDDSLILPAPQAEYAEDLCAHGTVLDYRVYPGKDHVGLVTDDSPLLPDLVAWTQARLAGEPATNSCE